jgi:hypothetical protein
MVASVAARVLTSFTGDLYGVPQPYVWLLSGELMIVHALGNGSIDPSSAVIVVSLFSSLRVLIFDWVCSQGASSLAQYVISLSEASAQSVHIFW